eukprot:TRINITY_DN67035_c0_g1_i1.p1 TRINITY_DN67035_c0_g1~~TRINITY_DN67035_c0_g1_i1.p1  ORF type:complete len:474 (-),score=60.56 TRINITY_DN67035_c0_g1_i1:14-1435(-)
MAADIKLRATYLFSAIDENHDGYLSRTEVENWIVARGLPCAFAFDFMRVADRDSDGRISLTEFSDAVSAREATLRSAFLAMDVDNDGFVSRDELEVGLQVMFVYGYGRYGVTKYLSKEACHAVVAKFPSDGRIDFSGFLALLFVVSEQDLITVSPYRMKAHWNNGSMELVEVPCRRKEGTPYIHLISGGVAGAISKTAVSPLDVVCSRLKVERTNGIFAMSASIWRSAGIAGFYQGNLLNTALTLPWKACDFFFYDLFKRGLVGGHSDPSDLQRVLAGALAGAASQVLLYPVGLLIYRMQVLQPKPSMKEALSDILRIDGPRGLYAGLSSTLLGVAPYSGISFAIFETSKEAMRNYRASQRDDLSQDALTTTGVDVLDACFCGAIGGWAGMMCAYPLNTVRSRFGMQGAPGFTPPWGKPYTSVSDALVRIVREEGTRGMFRSAVPSSIKMIPSSAVSFGCYEYFTNLLLSDAS